MCQEHRLARRIAEVVPTPKSQQHTSTFVLGALALVGLVVVAYLPLWHAGFIWDDDVFLTGNVNVQGGLDGLARLWRGDGYAYFPVTCTLFWLECNLWGLRPLGYHLVNIGLHCLGAVLVWCVLRRLLGARQRGSIAWLGAAFFALSPVNVASVAWVAEQKNTLSLVLAAACVLAYLRWQDEARKGSYVLAVALFVAALLAKATVIPLVAVLGALTWWRQGRLTRADMLALMPFLVFGMVDTAVAVWFEHKRVQFLEIVRDDSDLSRLLAAGAALWYYLKDDLIPFDLPIIHSRWNVDVHSAWWWIPLLAALSVLTLLWRMRARWGRGPVTAACCYIFLLAPLLGVFDTYYMRYSYVADHWQYLATIVVFASVAAALSWLPSRATLSCGALLILASALGTWRQAGVYVTSRALWTAAVTRNQTAWIAWHNLAYDAETAGRIDDAIDDYRTALRYRPDFALSHNNLATLLLHQGRVDEAIPHYEAAIDSRPDFVGARFNLASALMAKGRIAEATAQLEAAQRLEPANPSILLKLAWIRATADDASLRDGKTAVKLATQACEVTAYQNADAFDVLGAAYAEEGQFKPAIEAAASAVRLSSPPARIPIERRMRLYNAMLPFRDPALR